MMSAATTVQSAVFAVLDVGQTPTSHPWALQGFIPPSVGELTSAVSEKWEEEDSMSPKWKCVLHKDCIT